MATNTGSDQARHGNRLSMALWGAATCLLLLPLLAMQFTDEVVWGPGDFITFGAMLASACGAYELASRVTGSRAYRAAVGVALLAAFLLVWINLAVGIIGDEGNPANLMYGGVLAVGILGALVARFQPPGMVRALVATALAQALVALIVLIAGWDSVVMLTGFFVALWLTSAALFRKAARDQSPARPF